MLKSKNNNVLVEVDFKSCEPFFYLISNGYDLGNTRDVYKWISENYNVNIQSRDKFKRGILSMLYGANEYTTSKVMQTSISVVKKIKEDLGINELSKKLNSEFDTNGFVLNYYGRPITSNNNLVNYWIQSSAVDFCSLAFYEFYRQHKVKPCFFIHDSMTFEIEKNRINMLNDIKNIIEFKSNISIPVEFSILSWIIIVMRKLNEIGIGSFRPGREPQGSHIRSIDLHGPTANADSIASQRMQYQAPPKDKEHEDYNEEEDNEVIILDYRVYKNGKYCLIETLVNINESYSDKFDTMMNKISRQANKRAGSIDSLPDLEDKIKSEDNKIEELDDLGEMSGAGAIGGGPAGPLGYTAKGKRETPAQRRKRQKFNITKSYPYTK